MRLFLLSFIILSLFFCCNKENVSSSKIFVNYKKYEKVNNETFIRVNCIELFNDKRIETSSHTVIRNEKK